MKTDAELKEAMKGKTNAELQKLRVHPMASPKLKRWAKDELADRATPDAPVSPETTETTGSDTRVLNCGRCLMERVQVVALVDGRCPVCQPGKRRKRELTPKETLERDLKALNTGRQLVIRGSLWTKSHFSFPCYVRMEDAAKAGWELEERTEWGTKYLFSKEYRLPEHLESWGVATNNGGKVENIVKIIASCSGVDVDLLRACVGEPTGAALV